MEFSKAPEEKQKEFSQEAQDWGQNIFK